MDSKQPYTALLPHATASVPPKAKQPWRRRFLVGAATVMLLNTCYRGYEFGMGASLFQAGSASASGASSPQPPRCPAQEVIAPSTRLDITKHNVDGLFKSVEFRNLSVSRLAGAVQIPTQDFEDMGRLGEDPRWDTFYDLQKYFAKTFPLIHESLQLDVINEHNLVYTWRGKNETLKPVLLMSHLDTVPVADDTLSEWSFPPFSGHFDGTYIYGRGSHDCKNNVVGILSAVTALLTQDFVPERTFILAFGYDEESGKFKYGAAKIADHLRETYGVSSDGKDGDTFAIILDEGGIGINKQFGRAFATPQSSEKGYLDVLLDVHIKGGHSSIPPKHSSIGLLALAVARLEAEAATNFPLQLSTENPLYTLLQCAAEDNSTFDMPPPLRSALRESKVDLNKVVSLLADDAMASSLLHTTQAVTIFHAGNKANALPAYANALVNYRVSSLEDLASVQSKLIATLEPLAKELGLTFYHGVQDEENDFLPENSLRLSWRKTQLEPSPVSTTSSSSWTYFSGVIKHVFDEPGAGNDVVVTPAYAGGNTDTKYFWDLSSQIYRFGPLRAWHDQGWGGIHDVNERIALDAHLEAILFYHEFIRVFDEAEL